MPKLHEIESLFMQKIDLTEAIGALLLILFGAAVAGYSATYYKLGSFSEMGPGMFPLLLGLILLALGALQMVPALRGTGALPKIDTRAAAVILASTIAFAVIVPLFGLVPAIVIMTLIAVKADYKVSFAQGLILAAVLAIIALVIFRLGLSLPIPAFKWPFHV